MLILLLVNMKNNFLILYNCQWKDCPGFFDNDDFGAETSTSDLTSNNIIVLNIDVDNEAFADDNDEVLNSPTDLLVNSQQASFSSFDDKTWTPSCATKLLKTTQKHAKLTVFAEDNDEVLNSPTDLLVNSQQASFSSFDDKTWSPSCATKLLKTTLKHAKLTAFADDNDEVLNSPTDLLVNSQQASFSSFDDKTWTPSCATKLLKTTLKHAKLTVFAEDNDEVLNSPTDLLVNSQQANFSSFDDKTWTPSCATKLLKTTLKHAKLTAFADDNDEVLNSPTDLLVNSQQASFSSFDDKTWTPSCATKLLKTTLKHAKLTVFAEDNDEVLNSPTDLLVNSQQASFSSFDDKTWTPSCAPKLLKTTLKYTKLTANKGLKRKNNCQASASEKFSLLAGKILELVELQKKNFGQRRNFFR